MKWNFSRSTQASWWFLHFLNGNLQVTRLCVRAPSLQFSDDSELFMIRKQTFREIFHMSTVARLANMKNNRWWFLPAKNKKLHARHSLAEKKKSIANINHRNIIFSALCIAVERIYRREKFGFFPSQWRQMASKKCYTLEKRQQIESQQEAVISAKLKLGLATALCNETLLVTLCRWFLGK